MTWCLSVEEGKIHPTKEIYGPRWLYLGSMLNRGVRYVSRGMSFEYLTSIFSCQTLGRVKISQPGDAQEYKFMKYIQGNKVYNEIGNKAWLYW